jgi:uncharacterized protein YraI
MRIKTIVVFLFCLFWVSACSSGPAQSQDVPTTPPAIPTDLPAPTALPLPTEAPTQLPASPTPASQAKLKLQIISSEGSVNVRSGPDMYYAVVGQVSSNQVVEPLGVNSDGTWIQFKFNKAPDGVAWIFNSYTNYDRKSNQLAEVDNIPTPEISPTPPPLKAMGTVTVVNPDGKVNIRSGPGAAYPIVGKVNNGDPLKATGTTASGDWVQFQFSDNGQNTTAWIYSSYTDYDANSSTLPLISDLPPTPAP